MKRLSVITLVVLCLCAPFLPQEAFARQGEFNIEALAVKGVPMYNMRVSPDGKIAALFLGDGSRTLLNFSIMEYEVYESALPIVLFDLTTGEELGRLTGHTDYVDDVAFTPDGKQLASSHPNGDIFLWDIASMTSIQHVTSLTGSSKLEFLPDGKTLVMYKAPDRIGQFLLWDMETGTMIDIWRTPHQSYGEIKMSETRYALDNIYIAFDLSTDGTLLATATPNGEILLWDTAAGQQTVVHERESEENLMRFNIRTLKFSEDGKTLLYYDAVSKQIHFWDVASGTETSALPVGGPSFALSPSGDQLAWATREDFWIVDLAQPDAPTKIMDFPADILGTTLSGTPSITFSPDGSQMVIGSFGFTDTSENSVLYVITPQ